jgi:excinuclease UvrABC nuclease subunit
MRFININRKRKKREKSEFRERIEREEGIKEIRRNKLLRYALCFDMYNCCY